MISFLFYDGGGGGDTGSERHWHRNGPKWAAAEQDDSQFLRGKCRCVFYLCWWDDPCLQRSFRGIAEVRASHLCDCSARLSLIKRAQLHFRSSCQLFLNRVLFYECTRPCMSVLIAVLFSPSPCIVEIFFFIIYLSFCRLVPLFKRHVNTHETFHLCVDWAALTHSGNMCFFETCFADSALVCGDSDH